MVLIIKTHFSSSRSSFFSFGCPPIHNMIIVGIFVSFSSFAAAVASVGRDRFLIFFFLFSILIKMLWKCEISEVKKKKTIHKSTAWTVAALSTEELKYHGVTGKCAKWNPEMLRLHWSSILSKSTSYRQFWIFSITKKFFVFFEKTQQQDPGAIIKLLFIFSFF